MGIVYQVHDSMSINTMSLKKLLSASETKQGLAQILAETLLESFHGKQQKFVVVYKNIAKVNIPRTIPNEVQEHNHEEADTLIPLHVIYAFKDYTWCEVCVLSPDTDVFVLLIDVAANGHLGVRAQLKFITGKCANQHTINILERMCLLGIRKSQGLLGLHNFSGADWGGKFVGISKRTWVKAYLALDDDDPIIYSFIRLGKGPLSSTHLVDGKLPAEIRGVEKFVCQVYSPKCLSHKIPHLRWQLFSTKNLEGEMLPTTQAALLPHLMRTNYICTHKKSYTTATPALSRLEDNGWAYEESVFIPVKCLSCPAPSAVIELVKCGCKKLCKGNCSCAKNGLVCTPLCKCYLRWYSNGRDYDEKIDDNDDGDDN